MEFSTCKICGTDIEENINYGIERTGCPSNLDICFGCLGDIKRELDKIQIIVPEKEKVIRVDIVTDENNKKDFYDAIEVRKNVHRIIDYGDNEYHPKIWHRTESKKNKMPLFERRGNRWELG